MGWLGQGRKRREPGGHELQWADFVAGAVVWCIMCSCVCVCVRAHVCASISSRVVVVVVVVGVGVGVGVGAVEAAEVV